MRLEWVLVLGLAYSVTARDCLTSVAMQHMKVRQFEGTWYETGYAVVNETEADEFDELSCIDVSYEAHKDYFDVVVKYIENGKAVEETGGRYTATNDIIAEYTIDYPLRPSFNKYMFYFVCTDYYNYAVIYASQQFEAGHCSEFPVIMVRDRSKYEEIKNNPEMKQCIQEKFAITVDKFKNIKHDGCQ